MLPQPPYHATSNFTAEFQINQSRTISRRHVAIYRSQWLTYASTYFAWLGLSVLTSSRTVDPRCGSSFSAVHSHTPSPLLSDKPLQSLTLCIQHIRLSLSLSRICHSSSSFNEALFLDRQSPQALTDKSLLLCRVVFSVSIDTMSKKTYGTVNEILLTGIATNDYTL